MFTKQQLLTAVDATAARFPDTGEFSANDVVAELTLTLGERIPERTVRSALRGLTGEVGVRRAGRASWFFRYPAAMREAWREADELARELGGNSDHFTIEEFPASVTLTLEQARALVARLGRG